MIPGLVLAVLLVVSVAAIDICDKSLSSDSRCVVTSFNCSGADVDFSQVLKGKNMSQYEFSFDGVVVNCTGNSLKVYIDPKTATINSLSVTVKNSLVFGRDISIDTGDLKSLGQIELSSSSINTDMQSRGGKGLTSKGDTKSNIFFTGSCFNPDNKDTKDSANNITSVKSYGTSVPKDSTWITDGDVFNTDQFLGSGDLLQPKGFGGGRIYLRAATIKINSGSNITCNAYCGDESPATWDYIGTGGVIFVVANDLLTDFSKTKEAQYSKIFQARGGCLTKWTTNMLIGGGGRVYMNVNNPPKDHYKLLDLIEVSNTDVQCESGDCYGNTGTIYVSTPDISYLAVAATQSDKVYDHFCYTQLLQSNLNANANSIQVLLSGPSKVIYKTVPKDYPDANCSVKTSNLTLQGGARLVLYPNCSSSNLDTVMEMGTVLVNNSNLMVNGRVTLKTNAFSLVNASKATFSPELYKENDDSQVTDVILLGVEAKQILVEDGCSFSTDGSASKKKGSTTLILKPLEQFTGQNFKIESEKAFLLFNYLTEVQLAGLTATGSGYLCAEDDTFQQLGLVKNYYEKDMSRQDVPLGTAPLDKSAFVLLANSVSMKGCQVQGYGFVGIGALGDLNIDKLSQIDTSASGCPAKDLGISETGSKYLKICKVLGGSNAGRGLLGSQKNFENCKYVMATPTKLKPALMVVSGGGGQKNHQMDNENSGFGGGIIALYSSTLEVGGNLLANGGNHSEKDYTYIAGGAGGTISLVSSRLTLGGNMAVKGGLSDGEVDSVYIAWRRRRRQSSA